VQRIEHTNSVKDLLIVVFTDVDDILKIDAINSKTGKLTSKGRQRELENELARSFEDIQGLREEMQTSQEELKSTNEELQSTNEELQSTNEELTTSKEEMQSLNEELQTVNVELQSKVSDSMQANNDMKNLLNSTEIATLFLDKDLNIRRFTDSLTNIFKLRQVDIGRPFTDQVSELQYPDIDNDCYQVLKTLLAKESLITTSDNRWFNVRIMPYRTLDDRIDGLVITFNDITLSKNSEYGLRMSEERFRSLFETMSEMIEIIELIYDKEGQPIDWYIRHINASFAKFLGKTKNELIDKKVTSVIKTVEDYWFESFASVDKTGEEVRFENYGAEFDKYYRVVVWKVSENMLGVSFTDITEHKRVSSSEDKS
jgi:two-component system CheB/CheR fusion protein